MAAVVLTDVVEYWMLLVSAIIQGTSFGFFGPARVAMASELVGRENLGNAISLQSLAMNGTRVFAPSIAGALAGWSLFGIGPTYVVAGSFAVLMFAFSYVSFTPALVEGEFGLEDQHVGIFTSASSVGALLAGVWVAGLADSPRAQTIMTLAGILFGVMVIGLGLAPAFVIAVIVAVVAGAGTTTFQTLSNTLALRQASPEFQGRVQSIMQLGFAGFGLTALPLGVLAEQIGLRPTLVFMGTIAALAVLAYGMTSHPIADGPNLTEAKS